MAATIIPSDDSRDYSSCRVTIEVTGGCHRKTMRMAKYTKTIPYNCLSQAIQGIHRLGGKITSITISPSHPQVSGIECVQPLSEIAQSNVLPSPEQAESILPAPQPQDLKNSVKIPQVTKLTYTKQYTFRGEW